MGANRSTVAAARAVGRPAREAARRHGLRPALALRPGDADRRARTGPRVGDDPVTRALAVVAGRSLLRRRGGRPLRRRSGVAARRRSVDRRRHRAPRSTAAPRGLVRAAPRRRTELPNGVAGNPIHWVYAIPSDGADNLAGLASVMQADAEQIDAWWRGQDPARTPRNDVARFSCGAQLDITTVRIPRTSAQLSPLQGRFAAIVDALDAGRVSARPSRSTSSTSTGRLADANVCGQGGSDSSGFGAAVVYYRSCTGVSTAAVAVHEVAPHARRGLPQRAERVRRRSRAGTRATPRRTSCIPSIGGEPLCRRRSSTSAATTTTGIRADGRTRRTRPGSSASTARRRSR